MLSRWKEADGDGEVPQGRRVVSVAFRLEEPHKDFGEVVCVNVAWSEDAKVNSRVPGIEYPASLQSGFIVSRIRIE